MKKSLLLVMAGLLSCIAAFGQWNNDPAKNLVVWPEDKSFYSNEMGIAPNGNTWLAVATPLSGMGVGMCLQLIDSVGNIVFDEPLVMSEYPARTWVATGQLLFVDRDGNALVAVTDQRHDSTGEFKESYTIYKVSQEGEQLWGEEGLSLDGTNTHNLVAGLHITQIADGSYVFVWMHNQDVNPNNMGVKMQRVSTDGELLWNIEETRMNDPEGKIAYQYPYVVDAGSNQVIVVWAQGSNQDLMVRKLDFDGSQVWSEDTRVYRSGWGSIPIWTLIDVQPSGDGGVIISWNDDRYYTNIESAYLTYVKPNGEIGFTTGEEGQKLGYSGWRALRVKCHYDPRSDSFFAIWNECNSGQTWNRVVAQRVNKYGELLWGEEGIALKPLEQTDYAYFSIQNSIDDEVAFFYMRSDGYFEVESYVTTISVNDTTVRRESNFTKGTRMSGKSSMETTEMYNDKYWVAKWTDSGSSEDEVIQDRLIMQRINTDFTLGVSPDAAVEGVKAEENYFAALATLVEKDAMFVTNMPQATQATLAIYNVNGRLVATPFDGVLKAGKQYIEWNANVPAGIYVATLTTQQGRQSVKLVIK